MPLLAPRPERGWESVHDFARHRRPRPTASACDGVDGPDTMSIATAQSNAQDACEANREPAQLNTSGFQGCSLLAGITPFFPFEASHVYAVRLPVHGNSRFEVDSVVYSLINQPGIPICNGARSHRLDVWVQDTTTPDAVPQLQFTTVVNPTPSGAPTTSTKSTSPTSSWPRTRACSWASR